MNTDNISHGGKKMAGILEKIEVAQDQSEVFKKLQKGKRYQIVLDTGESVIIAVLAQGKLDETEDDDMSDEEFCKASQYVTFRDEEVVTTEQMIAAMAKNDRDLKNEPIGLYTLRDVKEKL
jgi:K+/H+ antiporter YhaU regulatory subunit KhtT